MKMPTVGKTYRFDSRYRFSPMLPNEQRVHFVTGKVLGFADGNQARVELTEPSEKPHGEIGEVLNVYLPLSVFTEVR